MDENNKDLPIINSEPPLVSPVTVFEQKPENNGAFPPLEYIEKFNSVQSGAADRILVIMEKEQDKRHFLEDKEQNHQHRLTNKGQWMAFIITLMMVGGGVISAFLGQPWLSAVFASSGVVPMITAFMAHEKKKG